MGITEESAALMAFSRWYLASFFTFVAIFYTSRILLLKQTTQKQVVFPGQRFCATWWNHLTFRVFRAMIWFICVLRLMWPPADDYLGLLPALNHSVVILSGSVLLLIGFLITIKIHLSFSQQWRSGIDPRGPAAIITNGVYGYSRNPMFVGVALSQLGFFLALPSVFTLVCLAVGLVMLYRQTLSEEQHLSQTFPIDYKIYTAHVRRWI